MRRFATLNVFATEEVRSRWRKGSVHTQPWPESAPLREAAGGGEPALLDSVSQAAISVRRIKMAACQTEASRDRESTRLNSSHVAIRHALFCVNHDNCDYLVLPA